MIPTRTSRPFGRISPRVSETDLARLIDRTIALRISAKREQGFAATNVGCDGRRRTTMFDGSACQTEGEICVAQRQDGISACIEVPAAGNGLTVRSVTFAPIACSPVTGWWILDDDGYLYRIPTGLQTDYTYWPPEGMPTPETFDLVRSGTWADLMCAAALTPPTDNDDGNCRWTLYGIAGGEDSIYVQEFRASIGGLMSYFETVPTLTGGANKVTVGGFTAVRLGVSMTNTAVDITYDQNDRNGNPLLAGQEYQAILYITFSGATMAVATLKGVRATAGSSILPTDPTPTAHFALGRLTVPYDVSGTATPVPTVTATTFPQNWYSIRPLSSGGDGLPGEMTGILIRDEDYPNPGARVLDITLPTADGSVATGPARIAFGYPFAFEFFAELPGIVAPYFCATLGQTLVRDDYDMAYVYSPRLGIEYGQGHLNLCGGEIAEPDDSSVLFTLSPTVEDSIDRTANLIQLPNDEVGLIRKYSNSGSPQVPQRIERYRVLPAPTDAATFALSHETDDDLNDWVAPISYSLVAWTAGDTTFTLPSGTWDHARVVPCVVWQSKSGQTHWTADADAKEGLLQLPSGGATATVAFDSGGAPVRQAGTSCVLTLLGPMLTVTYGWTFTYRDPVNGTEFESALSPLPEPSLPTFSDPTYRLTVTVPTGPTDTVRRTVYRFAYDAVGDTDPYIYSPWNALTQRKGALYDRMVARVGTIEDNVTAEFIDELTTLSFSGTRPPEPLFYVGSVTTDAPFSTYALAPLDL